MNNKEKINNMSSKEFAEKYASYLCDIVDCGYLEHECACPCYELCKEIPIWEFCCCSDVLEKWLEQEVK